MTVEDDRAWTTGRRGKRARRFMEESHLEYLAGALVMLARSGGGCYPFPATTEAIVDDKGDKKTTYPSQGVNDKDTQEGTSHDHDDDKNKKKNREEESLDHDDKKKNHEETSHDQDDDKKKNQEEVSHDHGDDKKRKTCEETCQNHDDNKEEAHQETSGGDKKKGYQETSHDDNKKKKARHEETTSHRCSICDKEFSSYQALGGHKTSHRQKNPPTDATAATTIARPSTSMRAGTDTLHECTICHRKFATGQALGGHKRKHYEGVLGRGKIGATTSSASAVTIAAASDNCGATSTHDHRIHGDEQETTPFDLNSPASPELGIDLSLKL